MKKYTVITDRNYILFEQQLDRFLAQGRKLVGGISVTYTHINAQGNLDDAGTPAYAYWQQRLRKTRYFGQEILSTIPFPPGQLYR
jgi:hypothetical protein